MTITHYSRPPAALAAASWLAVAIVAVVHTWPYRYRLTNLDGVSYLDVADAWLAQPWREAVNGYWSPLYSWVLAFAMAIARPEPRHEYLLVHAVNILLFLAAFAAWRMLLRELRMHARDRLDGDTFSDVQFELLATALFLWAGLTQLVVWMESPDLIVAACVFAASAMLLRLQRGAADGAAVGLGAALGIGYLAKAAMLPLAGVYLLTALAAAARGARLRRTAVAAAVTVLFAVPWMTALSVVKGRVTSGDAGSLNYLWFVSRSEDWPRNWPVHWPHWDGVEGHGSPSHPARRLHEDPAVYEFGTPLAATYPMWYDASYWHDGVSAQFGIRDQVRRLKLSATDLFRITTLNFYNRELWNPQPALIVLFAVLWGAAVPRTRWRIAWPVVLPAVAIVGLYALVYVEPRYLGGALLVIWAAVLAAGRVDDTDAGRRLLRMTGAAATVVLAMAIVTAVVYDGMSGWRRMLRGEADEINLPWHIASLLRDGGVQPRDPIAIIGNAQVASRWARLGRVRIIAEVPVADAWKLGTAEPERVQSVLDAFARAGVSAVLSEHAPPSAAREGWTEVVHTPYWIYRFGR